jgi:hypothetical protein
VLTSLRQQAPAGCFAHKAEPHVLEMLAKWKARLPPRLAWQSDFRLNQHILFSDELRRKVLVGK